MTRSGRVATLEEAKAQFRKNWERVEGVGEAGGEAGAPLGIAGGGGLSALFQSTGGGATGRYRGPAPQALRRHEASTP
jgi:hypothetical protein